MIGNQAVGRRLTQGSWSSASATSESSRVKRTKKTINLQTNDRINPHFPERVAQLNGEEIELVPIRARTATCRTIGVEHENGRSHATVEAQATSLQETDRVIYEIAWDAAVAPVGHTGLQVNEGVESDFVVDRSQSGKAIGDDQEHYQRDEEGRFVFEFTDGIEWPELNGGRWRFRLRVVNGAGTEVACSDVAIVDWNH
jgi:hypothetical protein